MRAKEATGNDLELTNIFSVPMNDFGDEFKLLEYIENNDIVRNILIHNKIILDGRNESFVDMEIKDSPIETFESKEDLTEIANVTSIEIIKKYLKPELLTMDLNEMFLSLNELPENVIRNARKRMKLLLKYYC